VSGSPQNLYVRINAFLALNEMPPGPILLKNIGSDALTEQVAYKKRRIRALLGAFPKLRFLLVGDSGEHDPEIYAAIRKESPARVAGIIIRVVPGADNDSARFTDMMTVDGYDSKPGILASLIGSGTVPDEGAVK
jgi:phosphatidate phosphatase APP1